MDLDNARDVFWWAECGSHFGNCKEFLWIILILTLFYTLLWHFKLVILIYEDPRQITVIL